MRRLGSDNRGGVHDSPRIHADPLGNGVVLSAHGRELSHVYPDEPWEIRYEYLRRIAYVLDAAWPALQPLRVLHVGAGALTLARYVAATRPGSQHVAVDVSAEVIRVVQEGLAPVAHCTILHADARDALADLTRRGQSFDAIVVDIFEGRESSPAHLCHAGFYRECMARLAPRGAIFVNVGDEQGQHFRDDQVEQLLAACRPARGERSRIAHVLALSDARVWQHRAEGNSVLAALAHPSDTRRLTTLTQHLRRQGPHPASVNEYVL